METTNEQLVERLHGIYEKNVDAIKGYDNAAENADSNSLISFFQRKSRERQNFNEELKRKMVATYGEVNEGGSATAAMHRTWMDIKSFFSGNSDESMLEECIRGDKAAIEEYEDILENKHLTMGIAALIRDQKIRIRTDLNKIKSLEDIEDAT